MIFCKDCDYHRITGCGSIIGYNCVHPNNLKMFPYSNDSYHIKKTLEVLNEKGDCVNFTPRKSGFWQSFLKLFFR